MDEMESCEVFAALFFAWGNQQSSNRLPIASSCFFLLLFLLLLPSKDNRHAREMEVDVKWAPANEMHCSRMK